MNDYLDADTCNQLVKYADWQAGTPAPVGDPGKEGRVGNKLNDAFVADRIEVGHDRGIHQKCLDIWRDVYLSQIGGVLNVKMEWFELPHLLRYGPGGKYEPHSDSENWDSQAQGWIKGIDRDYSGILYLNGGFHGGTLAFPNYNLRLHPQPGMLVCFPSDHCFIHRAEEVESGIRYAMVTWGAACGSPRVPGGRPNYPIMLLSQATSHLVFI